MTTIDARGLACPAPVVRARAAIKSLPQAGGLVQIFVDNQLAAENLERMSAAAGYSSLIQDEGDGAYAVTIAVGEDADHAELDKVPLPVGDAGLVVAIGKSAMGEGAPELGEILIKSFLYSLRNLDAPPGTLLLFNGGVKLGAAGANTVSDLEALLERGTRVLLCGTCLDYYELRPAVGEIANMYDIAREMARAQKVINL